MSTCPRWIKLICEMIICSSIGRVPSDSHLSDKAKIAFRTIGRPFRWHQSPEKPEAHQTHDRWSESKVFPDLRDYLNKQKYALNVYLFDTIKAKTNKASHQQTQHWLHGVTQGFFWYQWILMFAWSRKSIQNGWYFAKYSSALVSFTSIPVQNQKMQKT